MNTNHSWQPRTSIDAISFDCDSTLSAIEGINVLAEQNGVGEEVGQLTYKAMSETGINPALYEQRMSLVRPTRHQVVQLAQLYFDRRVPDVVNVIEILQTLGKVVYLISAGVNPAVKLFANLLGVPDTQVYAVDVYFDAQGGYASYDTQAPTTTHGGKKEIISTIKQKYPQLVHVGDGMNDVEVAHNVERFIGYGGVIFRENLAKLCDFYIRSPSMTALLPLVLTTAEIERLGPQHHAIYEKGLDLIIKDNTQR